MIDLYTLSGAPRPWRVALALVAKGLPYTTRMLEASKKEHKAPAFLALNPRGRTPVLVDGDFVLTESLAIIAHLDNAHPEKPLLGTTTVEKARIWEEVAVIDHDLEPAATAVNGAVFKGSDGSELVESAQKHAAELRRLDERLAKAPYLMGETITAADCVAFPPVRLTLRAIERFPQVMQKLEVIIPARLQKWVDRIEAMPGYQRTFPPHWRT